MRKITLFLFLINIHLFSFGQIVKGKIIDKNTQEEIPFATIYFSGTTFGTIADKNGHFEVDISKYKMNPLTFSAVGYYSKTIENFNPDKEIVINLIPKVYNINEAIVSSNSLEKQRKKNMKIFKRELLGFSENVKYCEIINEEDITFNYYQDEDTLKAFASKPVIIKNKALGYTIYFYMDKFAYYKKSGFAYYNGNFKFKEDTTVIPEFITEKRKYSYRGSRMHFFRSLWANELDTNYYRITDKHGKKITYEDIVIQDDQNNKYLSYEGKLTLYFYRYRTEITLLKNRVYFDKKGYYDPVGIRWDGFMANKRIADWLPLEYSDYP